MMEELLDPAGFEAFFTLAIRHGMRLLTDLDPGRQAAADAGLPRALSYFVARYGNARRAMLVIPPETAMGPGDMLEASARWMTVSGCDAPLIIMLPEEQIDPGTTFPGVGGRMQVFAYRLAPPSFRQVL